MRKPILIVIAGHFYDNSIDNQEARILFRTTDGKLAKQYIDSIPEWAETIKNKLK